MVGGPSSLVELHRQIRSASYALFEIFSLRTHVPFLQISFYSITMIVVSASSSCFTLAVPMCKTYCVAYTPRAWDPRSLLSMLNDPLYPAQG